MGFLSFFSKAESPALVRLPSGSFSVDAEGHVVASTLPQSFPAAQVREISHLVLGAFKEARETGVPLAELNIEYRALRLTAKELRGGAMIFVSPRRLGPG